MDRDEQVARFSTDLEALMNRYAKEYDLRGHEVVGILFCTAHRIAGNILSQPPKPPKSPPP